VSARPLSDLDARVLRATPLELTRSLDRIAQDAGCAPDVALSCLKRLRANYLVENDRSRPHRWLRTYRGDDALADLPITI
jgi:hypothetical protein